MLILKKNAIFLKKKNAKSCDVKILKKSNTPSNCTVTYYQTLEEAPWRLRLNKPKKRQKFLKTFKKLASFVKKMQQFAMLKPLYYH